MPLSAAISTIRAGMWRLGRIKDFNDPFDCLFAFRHRGLRAPDDYFSPFSIKFRNEEFSKYGILCFSRNCTTPAMWAHYGDRMTGVCFECEMAEDESLYEVEYTDRRLVFDVTSDGYINSKEARDLVINIIRQKHLSWRYEEEQRVFMKLGEGQIVMRTPRRGAYGVEPYHWLPIDAGVLRRAIVGPMATEGDVNRLTDIVGRSQFRGIPVVKAHIHPLEYQVVA